MSKLIVKTLIIFFLSSTLLFSQIINKIEVNGNKRFSKESIIVFSKLDIGNEINDDLINKSIKNLYDTNFFEDISITFENNKLTIDLNENPIIE